MIGFLNLLNATKTSKHFGLLHECTIYVVISVPDLSHLTLRSASLLIPVVWDRFNLWLNNSVSI